MAKKYTVEEIDDLRTAVKAFKVFHPAFGENSYSAADVAAWEKTVEEHVRTYMLNGTKAKELHFQYFKS